MKHIKIPSKSLLNWKLTNYFFQISDESPMDDAEPVDGGTMDIGVTKLGTYPSNSAEDEKSRDGREDDQSVPWFYNPQVFLPGGLAAFTIGGRYAFLAMGRFFPILDFISDIASAWNSCLTINELIN